MLTSAVEKIQAEVQGGLGRSCYLNWALREALNEKVNFERRSERMNEQAYTVVLGHWESTSSKSRPFCPVSWVRKVIIRDPFLWFELSVSQPVPLEGH